LLIKLKKNEEKEEEGEEEKGDEERAKQYRCTHIYKCIHK